MRMFRFPSTGTFAGFWFSDIIYTVSSTGGSEEYVFTVSGSEEKRTKWREERLVNKSCRGTQVKGRNENTETLMNQWMNGYSNL